MADQPPKLLNKKPNKAQVKKFLEQKSKEMSSSSTSASQVPPPPPRESFFRRNKYLVPMLLTVNLAVGGYLFMRTRNKAKVVDEEDEALNKELAEKKSESSVSTEATAPTPAEVKPLAIAEPFKVKEPIPESQQRELFKWMLEEKRKLKPQGPEEKKRIEEEKALLKQLIRAKSIPSI